MLEEELSNLSRFELVDLISKMDREIREDRQIESFLASVLDDQRNEIESLRELLGEVERLETPYQLEDWEQRVREVLAT